MVCSFSLLLCSAEENVHTAAIPIPSQHDPSQQQQQQDHRDSREKDSFTGGKHMNARMSTPISYGASQDATAENSSVSSSGGSLGAALGAVGMGTTPPLGSRFPRPTSTRDRDAAHRRSFHLPPHAEHGETAGYGEPEDGRGSPFSHGYPPLNIPPYQHQHQQQQGGWSGKHESPTHRAVSLDSQPHTLQNMIRATADAVSATNHSNHSNHSNANTASSSARPAAGSHRSSPLSMQQPHYQYQQQQQAQQQHQRGVSADGSHGGFPQPSQGIRIAVRALVE